MHLDAGAVQRHRLDADAHNLVLLQLLEDPVEDTCLGPAVHAGVDGAPIAEAGWQPAPLAAVLAHIKDRVEHVQIRETDIAALGRQVVLDLSKLGWRDLHAPNVALIER